MKTLSVALLFAACIVATQAGSLQELLKKLVEKELEDDLEEKGLYMLKTKNGAISGDLQTTNPTKCGKGCIFDVTITDWNTGTVAASNSYVYPDRFEFTGLSTDTVYEVKSCPKQYPKDCGHIVYCTLNTGDTYTTNHQCSTEPPRNPNEVINKIRALLKQLEE